MATDLSIYSATPGSNDSAPPVGAPEGWQGQDVNNVLREFMASVRARFNDLDYLDYLYDLTPRGAKTITRISDTEIRVTGVDATAYFTANRRLRLQSGGEKGFVVSSSFASGDTSVIVNMDAGVVPGAITAAELYVLQEIDFAALAGFGLDVGDSKITTYPVGTPPYPWLEENAQEIAVADWSELAGKYGATGIGDGLYDNHPDLGPPAAGNFRVADMRGMAAIGPAKSVSISNITQANPGVVTATAHGFKTGDTVYHQGVVGMVEVNLQTYTVTVIDANSYSIVDTSAFTAYTSGGTATEAVVRTVGQSDGTKDVTLTEVQAPPIQNFTGNAGSSTANRDFDIAGTPGGGAQDVHTHSINHGHSYDAPATEAHPNRQPSLVRGWVVKGK